jgi:flagellar hook assembly protein FlgD
MVNSAAGENLNTGTWNQNQVITTNLNTTLDNSWVDQNCKLIVFVYKNASPMYMANIQQGLTQSVTAPLGIQELTGVPKEYSLLQNYPNPFNPVTNIKFSIPKDGNVSLKIYDATGAVVQTYADGFMKAGSYNAEVDGTNLSSGVYFYTLKTADFFATKKMVLVK